MQIEARAGAVRNTAIGASEHNRTWLNLSAGPRLGYAVTVAGRPRPGRIGADAGVERRMRGGHGEATSLWGGLTLDQALDADWRVKTVTLGRLARASPGGSQVQTEGLLALPFARRRTRRRLRRRGLVP